MKSKKVSLSDVIDACLMSAGPDNKKAGIDLFLENQEDVARIVALYSVVLASYDDEVEACAYRHIATAAFEMSLMVEQGMNAREVVMRKMDQSNELNRQRIKQAAKDGESLEVNLLGPDGTAMKTKKTLTEQDMEEIDAEIKKSH